jgi:hypothetical protein
VRRLRVCALEEGEESLSDDEDDQLLYTRYGDPQLSESETL